MVKISEVRATPSLELFTELVDLLQDAVKGGASLGWTHVPSTKEARNYWMQVLEAVGRGECILLLATDDHIVAGAVQLAIAPKQNARHRGEVRKLMVHSQFRRRGIAKALMAALEDTALQRGIHLLVLDTREGDIAEKLYASLDYIRVGVIPGFALSTSGNYDPTVIFYRQLPIA